jgi:cobalt-zinc-cadmium efflux system protein
MSDHLHHKVHDHDGGDHDHQHQRGHTHRLVGHVHTPANFGWAFAIGITLNLIYVAAETIYGISAHSLALLADAGHNLSDVLGLVAAWAAALLSARRPSDRFTYGLGRTSVLAALGNAVALLIVTGGIAWEAVRRLMEPEPVAGLTVIVVAAIGVVLNGGTALLFMAGRKRDLNIRGAFLHMAADALVAFGVVIAGVLILETGWLWIDPVVSLVVSAVIVAGTWSLLHQAVQLSLDAVPPGISRANVETYLNDLPGVVEVHDLHIWALSTTENALTVHLVVADDVARDVLLPRVYNDMRRQFGIGHPTIQFENSELAHHCELRPEHVI